MPHIVTVVHVSDPHLHKGRLGIQLSPHQLIPGVHRPRRSVVDRLFRELATSVAREVPDCVAILSGDLSLLGKRRDIESAVSRWQQVTSGTWVATGAKCSPCTAPACRSRACADT